MKILADGLLLFKDHFIDYHNDDTITIRIQDDYIFMHDNVSCHKIVEIAQFLDVEEFKVMIDLHNLSILISSKMFNIFSTLNFRNAF